MLASCLNIPLPEAGERRDGYAAFTAVRMERARLGDVVEGDALTLSAWLDRRSHVQFVSRHVARRGGETVAILTMASAALGCSRVTVQRPRFIIAPRSARVRAGDGTELWRLARQMRSHRRDRHFDFDLQAQAEDTSFRFRPCPRQDFNGAGFLCFASFRSIVERAHWSTAPQDEAGAEPRSRDVFYYGNIDVGDSVRVLRAGRRCGPDRPGGRDIGIWDKVIREADGETIAEVFTRKILASSAPR
jgi:probable biosynthetic protein (TIGR04099 family)